MFLAVRTSLGLLTGREKTIFVALLTVRVLINFLDIAGLAAVGLLGAMLASGLTDQTSATFLGQTVTISSSQDFLIIVAIIASFFIGKSVLATAFLRFTTLFLAKVESRIAAEVVRFIYSGTLSRMKRFSAGDLQWAASASAHQATSGILLAFAAIITESALFLAVFTVFVIVDTSTAAFITAYFLLLILGFQLSINQRLKRLSARIQTHTVGFVDAITDLTAAFREISVLGVRERFLETFSRSRARVAHDSALQAFLFGLPRFFVESALMVGILALVAYQFARGTLSEGLVTTAVFLAGGVRMMAALLPLQNAFANLKTNAPQAEVAQRLVGEARLEDNATNDVTLEGPPSSEGETESGPFSVQVNDLSFTHSGSSEPALVSVSLTIGPGQFVAFVGPSGAGKTTLADLLLGLNLPSKGRILLSGVEPGEIRRSKPGSISYVPQAPGVVSGSLAENVALGIELDNVDDARVWECLEAAELAEYVKSLPHGVFTTLGRQGDALSGGQKQRLGLARALYTQPRLIVLDEATSALDASTEASITDTVRKLRKRTTLVVIAHRLSTIQHADCVYVIDEGRTVASGTFSEIRKKVPMIEEYVRLMSFGEENS